MITSIGPGAGVLTVIFEFDVEPEEQRALRAGLERLLNDIISGRPGFVSANLHLSRDGRKVLNYVQWESLDAFERFLDDEDVQRRIRPVIGPYAPTPRIHDIVFAT